MEVQNSANTAIGSSATDKTSPHSPSATNRPIVSSPASPTKQPSLEEGSSPASPVKQDPVKETDGDDDSSAASSKEQPTDDDDSSSSAASSQADNENDEQQQEEAATAISKPLNLPTTSTTTGAPDSPSAKSVDTTEETAESRRESIRRRLREREKRLTTLVRNSSSDSAGSFLGQMRDVRTNLEKVEQEKSQLEKELDRLKNATGDDEFLKEKMTGIQEGFMKQVTIIQKQEDEIVTKKNEIDHLRDELVSKLRRIVELEFDLETHNVHYTDYADEQFKLGEEALSEIKIMEKMEQRYSKKRDGSGTPDKLTPRKASKLIAKLLTDLDSLEARYKKAQLDTSSKMEMMKTEKEELLTKIKVLENRQEQGQDEQDAVDEADGEVEDVDLVYLRKRVETLEAKRSLNAQATKDLEAELAEAKKEASAANVKAKTEVGRLSLENDALRTRIMELEAGGTDDTKVQRFEAIEKRISENYDDITKLESELSIKERQIATLKKDITKLRVKAAANGNKDSSFSQMDRELLGSSDMKNSGVTKITDSTYVNDLQRQLHGVQQQLVKKDQELVIERAKAASTAAGLLARITELTGKGGSSKVDGSTSSKKESIKKESSRKEGSSRNLGSGGGSNRSLSIGGGSNRSLLSSNIGKLGNVQELEQSPEKGKKQKRRRNRFKF